MLAAPHYPERLRRSDELLLKKKLSLTPSDLAAIIADTPRDYEEFRNSYQLVQTMRRMVNFMRRHGLYPK
jgi:hypothetical protein